MNGDTTGFTSRGKEKESQQEVKNSRERKKGPPNFRPGITVGCKQCGRGGGARLWGGRRNSEKKKSKQTNWKKGDRNHNTQCRKEGNSKFAKRAWVSLLRVRGPSLKSPDGRQQNTSGKNSQKRLKNTANVFQEE